MIKTGQRYRHFKGNEYIILNLAHDSGTLEEVVVYQGQYYSEEFGQNPIWIRTKKNFEEVIERAGQTLRRFELID